MFLKRLLKLIIFFFLFSCLFAQLLIRVTFFMPSTGEINLYFLKKSKIEIKISQDSSYFQPECWYKEGHAY